MNENRVVQYVGAGAYLPGVPARDLTLAEYQQHKQVIEECPQTLYIHPQTAPTARAGDGEVTEK